jgi:hypothetical protein
MTDYSKFPCINQLEASDQAFALPAGYEDSAKACGDLTFNKQSYKRKRYSVVYSVPLGKVLVIDQVKVRYDRMRKRIKALSDVLSGVPGARLVMVGLTYKPGDGYEPNHIRDFMSLAKRKLGTKLLGYAWVGEMQERGAIHYHVLLYLAKGARLPKPDKAGWWKHGSSSVTSAKSPYYLLSYTKKKYQKDYDKFPKGMRAFAVWVKESLLSERLRYFSLKVWERVAIDTDGWESLDFWRKHHKACEQWQIDDVFSDVEEAENRAGYWLDAIAMMNINPVSPEPCPSLP